MNIRGKDREGSNSKMEEKTRKKKREGGDNKCWTKTTIKRLKLSLTTSSWKDLRMLLIQERKNRRLQFFWSALQPFKNHVEKLGGMGRILFFFSHI
jgi:hypothetical protein